MLKPSHRLLKKALLKNDEKWGLPHDKEARALLYEFMYRQEREMPWDGRSCYGVGLRLWNDLIDMGIID